MLAWVAWLCPDAIRLLVARDEVGACLRNQRSGSAAAEWSRTHARTGVQAAQHVAALRWRLGCARTCLPWHHENTCKTPSWSCYQFLQSPFHHYTITT